MILLLSITKGSRTLLFKLVSACLQDLRRIYGVIQSLKWLSKQYHDWNSMQAKIGWIKNYSRIQTIFSIIKLRQWNSWTRNCRTILIIFFLRDTKKLHRKRSSLLIVYFWMQWALRTKMYMKLLMKCFSKGLEFILSSHLPHMRLSPKHGLLFTLNKGKKDKSILKNYLVLLKSKWLKSQSRIGRLQSKSEQF